MKKAHSANTKAPTITATQVLNVLEDRFNM